ncbi:MAG: protein TonB [Arcticibacterium sp.]|jgi:protein TonB
MKQKKNLQTLDDMAFENRFKDYGAYQLRKNYKANLTRALAISISPFLLLMLSSFWIQPEVTIIHKGVLVELPRTEQDISKEPKVVPDKPLVTPQIKEVQTVVIPTYVEPVADESISHEIDVPTEKEVAVSALVQRK